MNICRFEPGLRMSQAVAWNGFVFLAGQVADDTTADVRGQTRQALSNVDRLLNLAGTDKTRLLSATIWLPCIDDYAAMNTEWDAWVPEGLAPARACVEARLAAPVYRVEIGIVAATPSG